MSISYPHNLPISHKRNQIIETVRSNQVTIISGETGSGKTTQLPKMCLELLDNTPGRIGCTQPRRIAALTVSSRVAEELDDSHGLVGHKIRFIDSTRKNTILKFMTDGVLLAEINSDKLLNEYKFLIIDEAHERSLNIDFLLGYLKNILSKRKDLKVLITSATIDTEAFSSHFDNAPVITVTGKNFPVETRYQPLSLDQYGEPESYLDASVRAVENILSQTPGGDILIFLPTEKDIHTSTKLLRKKISTADILPLYGRLHSSEQKKIFKQCHKPKVVVATNVAETSITVPGIRFVVDTGLARIAQYNFRSKTHSLPIRKISKASCDQRQGRCGRIGPGVCIRLFDEEDYIHREQYTLPEIKRSNLAEVILNMLSSKLGEPETFPFVDPPPRTAISDGFKLLRELGALDKNNELTSIGKIMASLPIDPCIARIIIEANNNDCLREIIIIASVLAIQDPRVRPEAMEKTADDAHRKFHHEQSDFMAFLSIWNLFHHVKGQTSWSRLKKFCISNFLSFQRMREWIDLHEQMTEILKKHSYFSFNNDYGTYEQIHKSLTAGFLRTIAMRKEGKLYQGPSNKELMIFPGSSQFSQAHKWILAASFLETSRLYGLTVAQIEPEWLEEIAKDNCSYSWSEPRYNKKSGQVIANEKVSLFGLILVSSRRVNYAGTSQKNKEEARLIFIQSALVENQLLGDFHFYRKNRKLLKKWDDIENRIRSKSILTDERSLFNFYNQRIPNWVCDRSSLKKYVKKKQNNSLLIFKESDIVEKHPDTNELLNYPETLTIGSNPYTLHYIFDPADEADGVTITIPFNLYPVIPKTYFDWLVPGFLPEKVAFLLKSLPKTLRKKLVPLNIAVDRILDDLVLYNGSLYRSLERSLLKNFKITVQQTDWITSLPPHLQMRINLIDIKGKSIIISRDISHLSQCNIPRQPLDKKLAGVKKQRLLSEWENKEFSKWEFSNLPEKIDLVSETGTIIGILYPTLITNANTTFSIQFMEDKDVADKLTVQALRKLIRAYYSHQFKSLKQMISTTVSGPSSMWFNQLFSTRSECVDTLLNFVIDCLYYPNYKLLFSEKDFQHCLHRTKRDEIYHRGNSIIEKIMTLLRKRREVLHEIDRHKKLALQGSKTLPVQFNQFVECLEEILPSTLLSSFTIEDLDDSERYLKALLIRIQRAHHDLHKDTKKWLSIEPHIAKYHTFLAQNSGEISPECLEKTKKYAKLLQEYRISLFAPEIKTVRPISLKILNQAWKEVQAIC